MSLSKDNLRVAIIGAGFISDYHVAGLRAAGGVEVTHLVGRRPDRTADRAKDLEIGATATDTAVVLANPDVDAVVIATPDFTHKDIAISALEAGKPVLLQKPMAMTSLECRDIIAAATRTGTPLTVSFMHRYFPEVRWLRERIAENAFGKIHSVRMRNATPGADWADWFFNPAQVAGGVVMQLGVHGIDLLQNLFGPISSVSALSRTLKPQRGLDDGRQVISAMEDNTLAAYEFAAGHDASHEMSFTEVTGCDRFRMEVYFEEATVWLRSHRGPAIVGAQAGGDPAAFEKVDLADEPLGQAHHAHWRDIALGRQPSDDTALAGLSTLMVAEKIYQAARERCTLAIAEMD